MGDHDIVFVIIYFTWPSSPPLTQIKWGFSRVPIYFSSRETMTNSNAIGLTSHTVNCLNSASCWGNYTLAFGSYHPGFSYLHCIKGAWFHDSNFHCAVSPAKNGHRASLWHSNLPPKFIPGNHKEAEAMTLPTVNTWLYNKTDFYHSSLPKALDPFLWHSKIVLESQP